MRVLKARCVIPGVTDLESLSQNIASFTVQNLGPGQSQVAIRGISAGQIVRDQPGVKEQVGVYLDESVVSLSLFTPDLELFDLNRVEVLRGPQGTLYGSGSLAGTVRYITNQPSVDALEGSIEGTMLSIDDGDTGGDIKGMINIPMGDSTALRVVGYYNQYAGFIDAIQPDGNVEEDVNEGERVGFRASLRMQPTDELTITPRVVYQDIDMDGFNRVDMYNMLGNEYTTTRPAIKLGDLEQYTQLEESFEDEFTLVDLQVDYDFGAVTLTSITSYTDRDITVLRDATALTGSITGGSIGLPEEVYTLDAPLDDSTEVEVTTQELRLSSNGDGALQWVAGFFYSDVERDYGQTLFVDGFEDLTGDPTAGIIAGKDQLFYSRIPYDLEQMAVFGEASYDFNEQWTLTLGVRWYDFEEDRTLNFDGIFADQTIGQDGETESDGYSPRAILSYTPSEELQFNAQVSQGFRLGGINDPLNEPLCTEEDLRTFGGSETFDDEEVTNYELGAKWQFGERNTLNVAVFYSEIEDLQATLTAGSCSSRVVYNVPDAITTGVEAELVVFPMENLEVAVSGSYIEAEIDSDLYTVDGDGNQSILAGIEDGNDLPTSPETQFAVSATYSFNLNAEWDGYINGTYQYVGERWTQIGDQVDGFGTVGMFDVGSPSPSSFSYDPELDDYQVANVRIGMQSESMDIAFFVNNIDDERAQLSLDLERGGAARVSHIVNQPRTYGVTARYNF